MTRLSDRRDAIEAHAGALTWRAHRGCFIALAIYAVALSWLCWRVA